MLRALAFPCLCDARCWGLCWRPGNPSIFSEPQPGQVQPWGDSVSNRDTASIGTPSGGKEPLCHGEEWTNGDTRPFSAAEKWNKKQWSVPIIPPACGTCKFGVDLLFLKLRLKFVSVYFTEFGFQVKCSPLQKKKRSRQHAITVQQVGKGMRHGWAAFLGSCPGFGPKFAKWITTARSWGQGPVAFAMSGLHCGWPGTLGI